MYGFLGYEGAIKLKGLEIKADTDFPSLQSVPEEDPVSCSDNMLTAVGRSENTNMKFNEAHDEMLDEEHLRYRLKL